MTDNLEQTVKRIQAKQEIVQTFMERLEDLDGHDAFMNECRKDNTLVQLYDETLKCLCPTWTKIFFEYESEQVFSHFFDKHTGKITRSKKFIYEDIYEGIRANEIDIMHYSTTPIREIFGWEYPEYNLIQDLEEGWKDIMTLNQFRTNLFFVVKTILNSVDRLQWAWSNEEIEA